MANRRIEVGPFSPLARMVDVGRALAHPTRVRLLALLAEGELCVCQTVAVLEQAASTISEHLSDLKRAGLVQERREGKLVFYRLADDRALRAHAKGVIARVADDPVVARDRDLVARLRKVDVAVLCAAELDLAAVGVDLPAPPAAPRAKR
jgi:DNA-binding transcriptional ArsR family regulator